MMCFTLFGLTSCGSKVDKAELDKKIMEAENSEKEPEFTDAEYEFMIDYLTDNFDEISKMDFDDKDTEMGIAYSFILLSAQIEGKLNQNLVKKYKKFQEKGKDYLNSTDYKENQEAIMKALQEADIDWSEAYEEAEAIAAEEDEPVLIEY